MPAADFIYPSDFTGAGTSLSAPPVATTGSPPPPQIGLTAGVGVGKTGDIINAIGALLASDPDAVAAVFVPDHFMSAEMAARLRTGLPGVNVEVWLGTDQPDPAAPTGAPYAMCQRGGDAKAVQQAGGSLSDLCGSRKRGFCPHHPDAAGTCGYIAQGRKAGSVRVWVLTHAMLGRPAPSWLRRNGRGTGAGQAGRAAAADLVVIDESFARALLGGPVSVPLGDTDPTAWPTVPDAAGDIAPGFADARLRFVLGRLHGVIAGAANQQRLTRAGLRSAGLSAQDCKAAIGFALRCKAPLPNAALPTSGTGKVAGLLAAVAGANRRVLRVDRLLRTAASVLDGTLGGAALRVSGAASGRETKVRWREPIHDDWALAAGGIVHADGTMQTDIATAFLPRLTAPATRPVAAPYVTVTQITDRAFGYSALIASGNAGAAGQKAADGQVRRLRRAIQTLGEQYEGKGAPGGADVLVVLPKALEDALRGKLPANVGTLHFGKLRGQDQYRGVAALAVVSRPLPPPNAVEDTAEILFGRDVTRLPPGRFYDKKPGVRTMANGTGLSADMTFHPDPDVEAVRWAACEAELIQAIGRGRGVRRTAADPLDVFVLTNVPLPGVLVSDAVTLDDLMRDLAGPVREMIRAGVLPLDWPGREAMLTRLGVIKQAVRARPGDAARQWFRDNPSDGRLLSAACAAVAAEARLAVLSPKDTTYGETTASRDKHSPAAVPATDRNKPAAAWPCFRYRRPGARQAGLVLVSPDRADAQAALELVVGPVDVFEPADAPRSAGSRRRQTPAVLSPLPHPTPLVPPMAAPVLPVVSPPVPSPVVPLVCPTTPHAVLEPDGTHQDPDTLTARLDAVPLGLPPVMDALVASAAITREARRRYLEKFRLKRGTVADRERETLAQIARDVGPDVLRRAARAAAAHKLGVSVPSHLLADRCQPPEVATAA
jgi:putative DNA primase/helicase